MIGALVMLVVGATMTLLGFRMIGKKPGEDPEYDSQYEDYVRHLKWLGPILLAIALLQFSLILI